MSVRSSRGPGLLPSSLDGGHTNVIVHRRRSRSFAPTSTHANHLADRSYEQVRRRVSARARRGGAACRDGHCFEEVEKDLEHGWLNVRVGGGEWASVREFALAGFDRGAPGQNSRTHRHPASSTGRRSPTPWASAIDPSAPDIPSDSERRPRRDRLRDDGARSNLPHRLPAHDHSSRLPPHVDTTAAAVLAGAPALLLRSRADADIVIRNGTVFDGLGGPGRELDVAIDERPHRRRRQATLAARHRRDRRARPRRGAGVHRHPFAWRRLALGRSARRVAHSAGHHDDRRRTGRFVARAARAAAGARTSRRIIRSLRRLCGRRSRRCGPR